MIQPVCDLQTVKRGNKDALGVPANNFLFSGRVPANNFLNAGGVPANNFLFAGRVPANNLFRHLNIKSSFFANFALTSANANANANDLNSVGLRRLMQSYQFLWYSCMFLY